VNSSDSQVVVAELGVHKLSRSVDVVGPSGPCTSVGYHQLEHAEHVGPIFTKIGTVVLVHDQIWLQYF